MLNKSLFSSNSQEWEALRELFGEPNIKIKPLSRKEFLKKWKDSPTIIDVLKIKDYGKRLKIATIWFPQLTSFVRNFFPELFEKSE